MSCVSGPTDYLIRRGIVTKERISVVIICDSRTTLNIRYCEELCQTQIDVLCSDSWQC